MSKQYSCKLNDLKTTLGKVQPGDSILIEDGTYNNLSVIISNKANIGQRITIRAKNPGKVIISGKSQIVLSGEYITFANFIFQNGGLKNSIQLKGRGNRLTGCDISFNNSDGPVILVSMKNNRIDHCNLHDFNKSERWIQKDASSKSEDYFLFDHNIIKNRPKGKKSNGYETLQIRNEDNQITSKTMIVNNYFEKCDGEIEMISIKSSENIVYKNTIQNVQATITLRSGRGSIIANNKFLQNKTKNSGGLRITGADHVIYNNLFKEIDTIAMSIINGANTTPSYQQVKNLRVLKNVFLNNDCDIELGNQSKGKLVPTGVEFRENIVYKQSNDPIFGKSSNCKDVQFLNNQYYATNFGKNPPNCGKLVKPNNFDMKLVDENKYGCYQSNEIEKVGIDWNTDVEDTEIVIELNKYYDNLKTKILKEL